MGLADEINHLTKRSECKASTICNVVAAVRIWNQSEWTWFIQNPEWMNESLIILKAIRSELETLGSCLFFFTVIWRPKGQAGTFTIHMLTTRHESWTNAGHCPSFDDHYDCCASSSIFPSNYYYIYMHSFCDLWRRLTDHSHLYGLRSINQWDKNYQLLLRLLLRGLTRPAIETISIISINKLDSMNGNINHWADLAVVRVDLEILGRAVDLLAHFWRGRQCADERRKQKGASRKSRSATLKKDTSRKCQKEYVVRSIQPLSHSVRRVSQEEEIQLLTNCCFSLEARMRRVAQPRDWSFFIPEIETMSVEEHPGLGGSMMVGYWRIAII